MGEVKRTNVVIVGAGASYEFGLPTGKQLLGQLKDALGTSRTTFEDVDWKNYKIKRAIKSALEERRLMDVSGSVDLNDYREATKLIHGAMDIAPSIDNVLDTHRQNPIVSDVGKIAIAYCLNNAERKSKLWLDDSNIYNRIDFGPASNSWAAEFFRLIAAKRDYSEFLSALSEITFISFNYDRCIKQFFVNAAKAYFNLSHGQLCEVLASLKVIHPYGTLGRLTGDAGQLRGFGQKKDGPALWHQAQGISTFTEGSANADLQEEIKGSLRDARVIFFLGFHFLPLNMELLATKAFAERVLASVYGRSDDTNEILRKELRMYVDGKMNRIFLSDTTCSGLFLEFDRYLQA